ncbi:MAG: GGDEF domain-containing protein [Thermodesulfobacteriota bacterium]
MEKPARKVLLFGIIIAIVFWFFDATIEALIFKGGSLTDVLLTPDLREVWKRLVIMALIVGSSLYARRHIMELDRMKGELVSLATTDTLTKAFNRTMYDEIIVLEIERARRFSHPLSMLMFDLDNFKDVNDTYGHVVGDEVLKQVADVIRAHTRKINLLVRWGGDEFIVIPVETALDGAAVLSERLRQAIEFFVFEKIGKLTASFGVIQFKEDDTEVTILKRLDDALYKAKNNGGNRVEKG